MGKLQLTLTITNRVVHPTSAASNVDGRLYWCHLTRIDAVEAKLGTASFSIGPDRQIASNASGDLETIKRMVATNIGLPEATDEEKPLPDDDQSPPALLRDVQLADEAGVDDAVSVEVIGPSAQKKKRTSGQKK